MGLTVFLACRERFSYNQSSFFKILSFQETQVSIDRITIFENLLSKWRDIEWSHFENNLFPISWSSLRNKNVGLMKLVEVYDKCLCISHNDSFVLPFCIFQHNIEREGSVAFLLSFCFYFAEGKNTSS